MAIATMRKSNSRPRKLKHMIGHTWVSSVEQYRVSNRRNSFDRLANRELPSDDSR